MIISHMFRLKQYKVVFASVLIAAVSGLSLCAVYGEPNEVQSNRIPTIMELITNCPPITDLVFKYTHGKEAPELYRFHYQSNAFFVRITKDASFNGDFSLQDTECGHWDNDYWHYAYRPPPAKEAPQRPPVLSRYQFDSKDTYSIAYNSIRKYLTILGFFTSLGISAVDGPNAVHLDQEGNLVYTNTEQGIITVAHFDYSNSVPVQATLKITAPDGRNVTQYVWYHYNPDIAEGRIPSYIESQGGYSIELISVSFGTSDAPLPKESFAPPKVLLDARDLTIMVHSNLTEYAYANGRLISSYRDSQSAQIASSAATALSSGLTVGQNNSSATFSPARRIYVLIVMIGFSVTFFIVLMLRAKIKDK